MGQKGKSKWSKFFTKYPIDDYEGPVAYHRRLTPDLEKAGFTTKYRSFADAFTRFRKNQKNITSDKKVGDFHWTDWMEPSMVYQRLYKKQDESQNFAHWSIETDRPICVVGIGDTQLGSWGTDMKMFAKITEEIINTPNLYVVLLGDLLQMSVKLRGVKEAHDNLIPVPIQYKFLDSWLTDIQHKVIASTWDNHAVMREENQLGYSNYAEIFKRRTIYSNGICHLDVKVNNIVYKFALSHFFRGRSYINPTHAPMRYLRMEGVDRDIAMQGDFHVPAIQKYREGQRDLVATVCGTIQTKSGYAERFFSLFTCDAFPCVVLHHERKSITPLFRVADWLDLIKEY